MKNTPSVHQRYCNVPSGKSSCAKLTISAITFTGSGQREGENTWHVFICVSIILDKVYLSLLFWSPFSISRTFLQLISILVKNTVERLHWRMCYISFSIWVIYKAIDLIRELHSDGLLRNRIRHTDAHGKIDEWALMDLCNISTIYILLEHKQKAHRSVWKPSDKSYTSLPSATVCCTSNPLKTKQEIHNLSWVSQFLEWNASVRFHQAAQKHRHRPTLGHGRTKCEGCCQWHGMLKTSTVTKLNSRWHYSGVDLSLSLSLGT